MATARGVTAAALAARIKNAFLVDCDVSDCGACFRVTPRAEVMPNGSRDIRKGVAVQITAPTVAQCEELYRQYLEALARLTLAAQVMEEVDTTEEDYRE